VKSSRYRIVRKLGEGGMGVVFAAHDERLDRPVAIKRLRPDSGDGQERERLWREARTAASVSHPNICQLYEIDSEGDELFLTISPLLAGRSESDSRPALVHGVQLLPAITARCGLLTLKHCGSQLFARYRCRVSRWGRADGSAS